MPSMLAVNWRAAHLLILFLLKLVRMYEIIFQIATWLKTV